MEIFEVDDYRTYIGFRAETSLPRRGALSRMAAAAGCHLSYLSQVMAGTTNLTADQASGLAHHWGLGSDETEILLTLVHAERASTPRLRAFYAKKIDALRKVRAVLSQRLANDEPETATPTSVLFYSDAIYGVIHLALTLPDCRTLEKLSAKLGLSEKRLKGILAQLQAWGLVAEDPRTPGAYHATKRSLHLPAESPLCAVNHHNWRMKAVEDSRTMTEDHLHYTALHTLSREDARRLRSLVLDFLEETRRIVGPSPEEEMVCLLVDYFRPFS